MATQHLSLEVHSLSRNPFANKKAIVTIAICLSLVGGYIITDRVRFEDVSQSEPGTKEQEEDVLSRHYPSHREIDEYLSDSTILVSFPYDNYIYYFDQNKTFISWSANGLEFGLWSLKSYLKIMRLGLAWRAAVVTKFCRDIPSNPPEAEGGNCIFVNSLDGLMPFSTARREHRKGNAFELASGQAIPPIPMPASPVTIDSLLALIPPRSQNR